MKTPILSAAELRELFSYDPDTGVFIRISHATYNRGAKLGAVTNNLDAHGYQVIRVMNNKRYKAHRLAWLYVHGEWPTAQIDHINGNRSDNRLCNLRCASNEMNSQNKRNARSDNKSGFLGVSSTRSGTFAADIQANNRRFYLGTFKTPEQAHEAYLQAKRVLHAGNTL